MEERGYFGDNEEWVREMPKVKTEDDEEEFRSCCEDEDELRERENCAKENPICKNDENSFSMYFKGFSVFGPGDYNYRVSGIGVIIENPCNEFPIRVQKKLNFYVEKSVADYLALLDGLSLAIQKDIKRISAFTDSKDLFNQIIDDEEEIIDNPLLLALRQRILEKAGNLDSFVLKQVPSIKLKNASHLARVAIGVVSDPIEGDGSKENCSICHEEKLSSTVLKLKCSHSFCSLCLKTYVEDKLRSSERIPIKCPQSNCKHLISLDEFHLFLPFASYESLERVLTEANSLNSASPHCPYTPGETSECVSLWDEGGYYTEDSSHGYNHHLHHHHPTQQQFEQWTWDSFVSLPMMMRDAYSDQERSQLALIQRFLAGGFGLSDHHHQQPLDYDDEDEDRRSSSRCGDSYADAMKDLHQLPWLERFVSVITDDYYEDYVQ